MKLMELQLAKEAVESAYCRRMNVKIKAIKLFRSANAFKNGEMDQNDFINDLIETLEDARHDGIRFRDVEIAECMKRIADLERMLEQKRMRPNA